MVQLQAVKNKRMKNIYIIIIYCIAMACMLAVMISEGKVHLPLIFIIIFGTWGTVYLVRKNNKMKK